MNPVVIFLIVLCIVLAIALTAIFGWRFVEKHTFSEFFVGQVIGEQKLRIPGFKQYTFSYKKRGKPVFVNSRPVWYTKKLKNGALYKIQVYHRRIRVTSTAWAVPAKSTLRP